MSSQAFQILFLELIPRKSTQMVRFLAVDRPELFPREARVGDWGEASLQGQSTPTGRSFVPSVCACMQCYSYRIRDEVAALFPSLFPFALEGFPFPSRINKSSVSQSEGICESEVGRNWVNLRGYECG